MNPRYNFISNGAVAALIFVALTLVAQDSSRADVISISTAMGNGADAMVRGTGGPANFSHGGAESLEVRNATGTNMRKSYLRFDLSSLAGSTIESVSLKLNFVVLGATASPTRTFHLFGLPDISVNPIPGGDGVADGWVEGNLVDTMPAADDPSITWNNAPLNRDHTWAFDGAISLGKFDVSSAGLVEIVQSSLTMPGMTLLDFVAQDTNSLVTLMLSADTPTTTSTRITAKEGISSSGNAGPPPTISFNVEPQAVPEPSSIILLALAAAVLFGVQCKRHLVAKR